MNYTDEQLTNITRYISAVESNWTYGIDKYKASFDAALSFSTRVEYLQWVAEWKDQYAKLTKTIRHEKNSRKPSSPTYHQSASWDASRYGVQARTMLFIRHAGKEASAILRALRIDAETKA